MITIDMVIACRIFFGGGSGCRVDVVGSQVEMDIPILMFRSIKAE